MITLTMPFGMKCGTKYVIPFTRSVTSSIVAVVGFPSPWNESRTMSVGVSIGAFIFE